MSTTFADSNHQLLGQTPGPTAGAAASDENRKYDNFYTPSNELFYNSAQYSSLDPSKQEIRLLKLLSTDDGGCLETELVKRCFLSSSSSNRPQYLAISYCAGDPKNTISIKVNGVIFYAFAPLARGLRQIFEIETQHGEDSVLIWADQICIDQSASMERSHQVRQMRTIYENAREVVAYLGENENDVGWVRIANLFSTLGDEAIEYAAQQVLRPLDDSSSNDGDLQFCSDLASLYKMFKAPWWGRGWVCQEIVVAQNIRVLFGKESLQWNVTKEAYMVLIGLYMLHVYDHFDKKEQPRNALQLVMKGHPSTSYSLMQLRISWEGGTKSGMGDLLYWSRSLRVSDPRDKIYAFLGLTQPDYGIIPDYTVDLETVFLDTCKKIILHDKNLEILSFKRLTANGLCLPSWVPDWSSKMIYPLIKERDDFRASAEMSIVASFPRDPQGRHDRVLRVACLVLDQLSHEPIISVYNPSESGSDRWRQCMDISGLTANPDEVYFNGRSLRDAMRATVTFGNGNPEFDPDPSSDEEEMGREGRRKPVTRSHHMSIDDPEWVFFRSPKGYLGIARSPSQYQDQICILLGAPVPFILRQEGEHYILIGEAYVHGFMYGEAIEMMQQGELDLRVVDIY